MRFFSFGFRSSSAEGESELPEIFPMKTSSDDFQKLDIFNTYTKILTDTIERTYGIPDEVDPLLWDNCVQSNASTGLVSLLAGAMTDKTDLFLVYNRSVGILRKADQKETERIKLDYEKNGESPVGVYISFRNYIKTDVLRIYSGLEYCVIASLHKSMNVAKALQVKINDLRASVSLADSDIAKQQARSIGLALGKGSDVILDVKDDIHTPTVDMTPTEKAVAFLDAKRAFALSLPLSYLSGAQTPGIGSTGEADMRAVERGLKNYFVSIVRPVLNSVFEIEVEFKSQDFRNISTALEALKTFELVGDENISRDAKREILNRMFDVKSEIALEAQGE